MNQFSNFDKFFIMCSLINNIPNKDVYSLENSKKYSIEIETNKGFKKRFDANILFYINDNYFVINNVVEDGYGNIIDEPYTVMISGDEIKEYETNSYGNFVITTESLIVKIKL